MAKTKEFSRTVSGTINSGVRSVFGGEGRRYFIIEHKDDSATHRRGEQQKMIVDEVFIGRDKKCQVLIDEQFGTVSREHAVIVRDGDRWKLIHRSSTNDTFVNGQRVIGEQILQNGDEIQLSYNGPRLGFIIPQGDQSLVKSIGMTARLNLFRQQALRPYKTALTLLSILFCLAVAGLVTGLVLANKETRIAKQQVEDIQKVSEQQEKEITGLRARINSLFHSKRNNDKKIDDVTIDDRDIPNDLAAFEPYVYLVKMTSITIDAPKGSFWHYLYDLPITETFVGDDIPIATGFITSNGYLITARHVIEPWAYKADINDEDNFWTVINGMVGDGLVVDATIVAESSSGDHKVFNYSDFSVSRTNDVAKTTTFTVISS